MEQLLNQRTSEAEASYLACLDAAERERSMLFLSQAKQAALAQWSAMQAGHGSETAIAPVIDASYSAGDEHPVANGDENNSNANPDNSGRRKELSRLADCTKLRALEGKLRAQCEWEKLERLGDLRHPETSHAWLWHIDATQGSVLCEADYFIGVQKRLGGRVCEEPFACRLCGALAGPKLQHREL